jgi:hypothetical protein
MPKFVGHALSVTDKFEAEDSVEGRGQSLRRWKGHRGQGEEEQRIAK